MSNMKFCPSCQRNVNTEHSWSTGALIVLLLFAFPIGLIYLAIRWKRRCPVCHSPDGFLMAPYFPPQGTITQGPGYTQTISGGNYTLNQPPQQGRYP
jgi:hypothetical protein